MKSGNNIEVHKAIPPGRNLTVLLTIGIGVVISFTLFMAVKNWEKKNQRIQFESHAESYASSVESSLTGNIEALMFLGDFFNNSEQVTRQEFSNYVKSVLPRYPGIQAFSWNPLVLDHQRAVYEAQARNEGFENFAFTERSTDNRLVRAAQRKEYVVVYYIDPLETNRPALGYDIASNPTRLKAIMAGFNNGRLSATGRITLVQETGSQYGILLLLPIYHQGGALQTAENRYQNRKGFVVEVLRIGKAVEAALKSIPDIGINVYLYDMSADIENRFLHYQPSRLSGAAEQPRQEESIQKGLYWSNTFDFAGRQWKIVLSPSALYLNTAHLWHPWAVLASSLLLFLLTAFYLRKRAIYIAEIDRQISQEHRTSQQLAKEISEREFAEKKAIRFGHILERSLNEIYVFDAETFKFIQVNEGARKNLGYTMEELQDLTPLDIKTEFTEDAFRKLAAPLRTGFRDVIIFKTVHKRKDESHYPVEVHLQYVAFDPSPVFVAIIIDITDKLRMEDRLQQAQKMEAIGTLAGGIAHDFNNILSAIRGYTELSLYDVEKESSLYQNLREVLQAGGRAEELIRQILTFSRQTEHERKPIQVKPICQEVLKFLRSSLPATIEIRQDIRSDAAVMADPTQIHQVIMNLCTNAEHAMRENGGTLEVKLANVTLGAESTSQYPELTPGRYLELTVTDTGHGIPAHILDRIFHPFFTTKKTGEGTGMGLSVAHGIVRSYQGAITASSQPGKGSTFRVYLPIVEAKSESEAPSDESVPTGTERILFVDDEPSLVNIGERILASLGYQVTTQTTSMEALEMFQANPDQFDLVITDMAMPNMSGDKLAEELMKIRPDIPVILCTGYSSQISDETAMTLGIKAFAYKPVSRDDLAKLVRQVLGEAGAGD